MKVWHRDCRGRRLEARNARRNLHPRALRAAEPALAWIGTAVMHEMQFPRNLYPEIYAACQRKLRQTPAEGFEEQRTVYRMVFRARTIPST